MGTPRGWWAVEGAEISGVWDDLAVQLPPRPALRLLCLFSCSPASEG